MTENHLTSGQLLRALDDELTAAEAAGVETHLDSCDVCRLKLRECGVLSAKLDEAMLSPMPLGAETPGQRAELQDQLLAQEKQEANKKGGFWYSGLTAAAVAAGLALVLLVPSLTRKGSIAGVTSASATAGALQVDGETFVALPYSNSEVSAVAPRIVEMEVPVSALTAAGVVFEPVSSAASDPDRSVRADVLLGADGEPLGVHVLSQQ